jgi:hypothetical protein
MTSSFPCDRWLSLVSGITVGLIGIAVACTSEPLPMTSGQTTTTYGTTNSTNDDDDPTDVTDDGPPGDATGTGTEPDPTDDGPDDGPVDDDDDDSGSGPFDIGPIPDAPSPDGLPDGSACTADYECMSGNCYVMPFLGGFCGQCNEDADCFGGGCTPPNPFEATPPYCNMGELGAGCESDSVCSGNLACGNVFDLLGVISLNTCGSCLDDAECGDQICAPIFELSAWAGQLECIDPQSLPKNAYCNFEFNGDQVCASGICSVVDVMGLAEVGVCGECNVDADCGMGWCQPGELVLESGQLFGSTCF